MRRRHRLSVALLLLVFAIASEAYWTDRLGLAFKDDCQEHPLIVRGWFAWAASWLGGRKGVQVGEACEQKETRCPESRFVTGIQVRYGRGRHDRDSYDFNVRCAKMWNGWLGLRFRAKDHQQREAALCAGGAGMTGVQVMRGRREWGDADYYNFRVKCAGKREWGSPLGLAFDGLRETRSATCRAGYTVAGLRVTRAFQDWGDLDMYEFQLYCQDDEELRSGGGGGGAAAASASPSRRRPSAAARRARRRPKRGSPSCDHRRMSCNQKFM